MNRIFVVALVVLSFGLTVPGFAQEDAAAGKEPEKVLEAETQAARNEILTAAQEIAEGLDKSQARHFNVMYSNYNIIQVVESVQDHVALAVDACGDANPDLKVPLKARFDEWKAAIKPVIGEADANIGNMILAQDYKKPRDIRAFFKLVSKTRKEQDKATEKVPVTSPEACKGLLVKMGDTQENMVKLLRSTLVSLPRTIQAEEDEARRKAQEKADEEQVEPEAQDGTP